MTDDDLSGLEKTAHDMIMSLVLMRALSLPRESVNEALLIDNYISVYAVRQAMWNAVQQGMFIEQGEGDDICWVFNENWTGVQQA